MPITQSNLPQVAQIFGDIIADFIEEINETLAREKEVKISFGLKLMERAGDELDTETNMSFSAKRVKDKIRRTISSAQMELFNNPPGETE